MSILRFPHINRKISATIVRVFIKPIFFITLVSFIILNLLHNLLFGLNQEKILKEELMRSPQNVLLHEKLAQFYLGENARAAEKEYILADELFIHPTTPLPSGNTLGIYSSPWQTWQNLKTGREKLENELKFWQLYHQKLPQYQYATLKLAVLNLQTGNKEMAKELLWQIINDSPTDKMALDLLGKLD